MVEQVMELDKTACHVPYFPPCVADAVLVAFTACSAVYYSRGTHDTSRRHRPKISPVILVPQREIQ